MTLTKYVPRILRDDGMIAFTEVAHYDHLDLKKYVIAAEVDAELAALKAELAQKKKACDDARDLAAHAEFDHDHYDLVTQRLSEAQATCDDLRVTIDSQRTQIILLQASDQAYAEASTRQMMMIDHYSLVQQQLAAMTVERDKWKRWAIHRIPTHGTCCTCQRCGLDHDSCRCDLDEVCAQLEAAQAEIAHLKTANKDQRSKLDEHNISDVSMGWG